MDAGTVAVEPEDGSMMCRLWWLFTDTEDTAVAANPAPTSDLGLSSSSSIVKAGIEVGASSGLCR